MEYFAPHTPRAKETETEEGETTLLKFIIQGKITKLNRSLSATAHLCLP